MLINHQIFDLWLSDLGEPLNKLIDRGHFTLVIAKGVPFKFQLLQASLTVSQILKNFCQKFNVTNF